MFIAEKFPRYTSSVPGAGVLLPLEDGLRLTFLYIRLNSIRATLLARGELGIGLPVG